MSFTLEDLLEPEVPKLKKEAKKMLPIEPFVQYNTSTGFYDIFMPSGEQIQHDRADCYNYEHAYGDWEVEEEEACTFKDDAEQRPWKRERILLRTCLVCKDIETKRVPL